MIKRLVFSLFVCFAGVAFADQGITLNPGTTITLTAGQTTTVTCAGAGPVGPSLVARYCRCDTSYPNWYLRAVLEYSDGTTQTRDIDSGSRSDGDVGALLTDCREAQRVSGGACHL